ncbi:hypothetical protein C8R45DRAFT_1083153 [Mycena sanguinolenta]|nr:hypothetical protein C8R45DRAFT_1083153 [Mycena sanguinolenta]
MLFPSASSRLITLFTVYLASVLALNAERTFEKRDALSDSGLSSASWIWLPEPDLLTTAPVGSVALIQTLISPPGKTAASASIAITVDNNFTLWVNGQPIGASDGVLETWQTAHVFTAALNASSNVVAVLGANIGTVTPNPAGLLAAIRVFYTDGSNETVLSNNTWLASGSIPPDFPLPHDLSSFVQAEFAATYGSGPWGTSVTIPAPDPNPLNLTGSAWIWSTANASVSAAVGSAGFRKTVTSPAGKNATSATVLLTVDNTFQLFINGQFIGSPPFDDNASGEIGSWEYAQLFTDVPLTPTTNVFTVLATNFAGQQAGGGPSSAGVVATIQITFLDGSNETIRTDETWLTAPLASASSFLGTADSSLTPAISSGLFGISPWGTLRGTSDVLGAELPANNAAVVSSVSSTPSSIPRTSSILQTSSNPRSAPTSTLPPDNTSTSSATPSPTTSSANSTRAAGSINSRSILVSALSILMFCLL